MTQLYLGVGHGITPKGAFDQGAQAPGRNEYELNWQVVAAAAVALERCGISFINEEAAGKGHDPDWVGSANNLPNLEAEQQFSQVLREFLQAHVPGGPSPAS